MKTSRVKALLEDVLKRQGFIYDGPGVFADCGMWVHRDAGAEWAWICGNRAEIHLRGDSIELRLGKQADDAVLDVKRWPESVRCKRDEYTVSLFFDAEPD